MEFDVRAGYGPVGERIEGDVQFLTPDGFALLAWKIPEGFKVFVQFLVMTGTRFGEATAATINDIALES